MHRYINTLLILFVISAALYAQDKYDVPYDAPETTPIFEGQKLPGATVMDIRGEEILLTDLVKEQPAMFIIYRGGWCPYCNMHLSDMMKIEDDIKSLGYNIYALSMDKPEKLRETLDKMELGYTLLSDSKADAAVKLGIAFRMSDELVDKYKNSYHIDLEGDSGEDHHILPVPGILLVDTEGIVTFAYFNPNYRVRINGDMILAAAKYALEIKEYKRN